jgi:hypothetical protein
MFSNITSRITGYNNANGYNSNYESVAYKKFEPDFQNHIKKPDSQASLAMRHITTKGADSNDVYDDLSKIFYSTQNMNRIQKMLKKTIFERTKGSFRLDDDQDESDLLVAMRAVFLEHARFLPFKLVHQVKELNKRTVEYIVPDMITEIKQYYSHIKEINEPIKPIPRPMNVNNAGRRTLPALTSAWGF